MPSRNRPAKRVLVRWSDDLDKGVLLSLQYACSEAGIKLPWQRVAEIMGPQFTEGAIIQHLAKLRTLMATNNIPVPPPMKRGMVTKTPSKVYANANNKIKFEPISPIYPGDTPDIEEKDEEDGEPKSIYDKPKAVRKKAKKETPEPRKPKGKGKPRARGDVSDEDEEEETVPELYDSDEDFTTSKKKRRTTNTRKSKAAATKAVTAAQQEIFSTPTKQAVRTQEEPEVKVEEEDIAGPATRTRGVKRDYSVMAAPSDDDVETGEPDEANENLAEVGKYDSEEADEDENPEENLSSASSEVLDKVQDATDFTTVPSTTSFNHRLANVTDVPYGQITMGPVMQDSLRLYETGVEPMNLPHSVLCGANPANIFDPRNLGASFISPSIMLSGLPQGNSGHLPSGQMGMGMASGLYAGAQEGFSGAAWLNVCPQGYSPSSQVPNLYSSSTDSSFPSTRNNSVVGGTMAPPETISGNDVELTSMDRSSPTNAAPTRVGDVIREEDMKYSMPSDDMVFDPDNYLVHDF